MSGPIRVGTRRSALALAQTDRVVSALRAVARGRAIEVVPILTDGDRTRATTGPLDFTDALDRALEEGAVDLAVHSAKDLPARLRPTVRLVAVPGREDPRDALVLRRPGSLSELPAGARIGSSSLRRRAQLLRARPDLHLVEIRGNVDSRVARVRRGELDGVILAAAGLRRLGRAAEIDEVLGTRGFLPAPGQGALAVTARAKDRPAARLARALDDPRARAAVTAERAFSAAVGGECNLPLAALGSIRSGRLTLRGEIFGPREEAAWSDRVTGPSAAGGAVGRRLGLRAERAGAIPGPRPGPGG